MKKIIIMSLFSLFTFGCSSNKEFTDSISSLERFSEKWVPKMINYIENDEDLSKRTIHTFYMDLEDFQTNLEKLKKLANMNK